MEVSQDVAQIEEEVSVSGMFFEKNDLFISFFDNFSLGSRGGSGRGGGGGGPKRW